MSATYTKLKSGEWGIRIEGGAAPAVGTKITVRKKSGETKTETVAKVVWSGNGIHLCAVAGAGTASYTPKARRGRNEDDRCELCDGNKWTCGHCIGW